MRLLTSQEDLDASLARLALIDTRLDPHIRECSPVALRQNPSGLAGLLQIILAQQVSVASARAIWAAFQTYFPDCSVDALLGATDDEFRLCKLSRPKVKTVRAIARAMHDGFDLEAIKTLETQEAKRQLVGLYGVGPWTADVYLLFCLGVQDVFPAGDLALQVTVAHVLGLEARPSEKELEKMAQLHWSPERGAAAHLFWAIYRNLKSGRDGVV